MSYLTELRKINPGLEDYSDDEIIAALPEFDPGRFANLKDEDIRFTATNDEWQITKGFKAGIDQTQALGGGLVALAGDAVGSDTLKNEGLDYYNENMQEASLRKGNVEGFTDIEGIEDTVDWTLHSLGNLAPTMATVIGTGGIGGAIANIGGKKLVKKLIDSQVERGVSLEVARKVAGKELAKRIAKGNAAGAYAGSTGLESGSIYGETGDVGVSLTHGMIAGAFDAMPVTRILNKFGLAKEAKEAITSSVKAEMLKQGIFEGSTEALQSLTEQHAKYWVENNSESLLANLGEVSTKELIDSFAVGVLGGVAIGGLTGKQAPKPIEEAQEVANKEPQEKEVINNEANLLSANNRAQGIDSLIIEARRNNLPSAEIRLNNAKKLYVDAVDLYKQGKIEQAAKLHQKAEEITSNLGYQDVINPLANSQEQINKATEDVKNAGGDALDQALAGSQTQTKATPEALQTVNLNSLKANKETQETNDLLAENTAPQIINSDELVQIQESYNRAIGLPTSQRREEDLAAIAQYDLLKDGKIQVEYQSPKPEFATITEASPVDVTTGQIQNELNSEQHLNALYGSNNPVQEQAKEGKYIAKGEMETPARMRSGLNTQPALEDRSFQQLETDNAQLEVKESYADDSISKNVIERMANLPKAITYKPTVSVAEFNNLQRIYRQVIKTPLRDRKEKDRAAVVIYHKVKKGDIEIKDTPPKTNPAQTNSTQANAKQENKQNKPKEKITDFGERIEGAKKHIYSFNESLSREIDSSTIPLSKSFPKPDYEKLALSGIETEKLAYIAIQRARIAAKPRKGLKLERWKNQVDKARSVAQTLLEPGSNIKDLNQNEFGNHDEMTANLAKEILPNQIQDLAYYKIRKQFFQMYGQEKNVTKFTVDNIKTKSKVRFDSQKEALAYVKKQVTTLNEEGKPLIKFDIWSERHKAGYFIGKKVAAGKYIELHKVDTVKEAREYVKENNEKLTAQLKDKKHIKPARRATNEPRIGKDYRKGKNVTPELFSKTFGFRGVQFGNWVEGDKRQKDLNNAYDGLLDLAELINVSPKAISLNGELGLAFGARGKGGKGAAMAHYEPSRVVINLTKKSGAGSLAHEWFHALDNYFGKMDEYQSSGFVTDSSRPNRIRKVVDGNQVFAKAESSDFAMRQEAYDAFKGVQKSITENTKMIERSNLLDNKRTKNYWSTVIEMTARSFESYVISKLNDKKFESDYLANIVSEPINADYAKEYPYPLKSEMDVITKAYDHLFNTLETKGTDKGVALFARNKNASDIPQNSSANQKASSSLSPDAVKAATSKIGNRLRLRGVKISVVDTESGLPESIRQQSKEDGAEGSIDAVYHDKSIYIVADRMDSIAKIEEAVLHESAHFGGSALFGSDLNKAYQKLALKLGGAKGIQKKAAEYGFDMDHYFETADQLVKSGEMNIGERSEFLVDEFLAHANGLKADNNLTDRIKNAIKEFIGRVRDILRKLGAAELSKITDSDITFLLKKLQDAAKGKTKYADRPHFMSATDADIQEIIKSNISESAKYSRVPNDAPILSTDGDGIGEAETLKEMTANARSYAKDHFAGDTVRNKEKGHEILIPMSGVRHTTYSAQAPLLKSVAVIPDILKQGKYIGSEPDSHKNNMVKAVHYYGIKVDIEGELHDIVAVVKEDNDGHRYYDHSIESKNGLKPVLVSKKGDLKPLEPDNNTLDSDKPNSAKFSRSATADQFTDLDEKQKSLLNKIAPKTVTQRIRDRIKAALDRGGLKTRQGLVDKYAALFELDKQAHGDEVVENHIRMSSWVLAKMSHAADGALSALMGHGRIQLNEGVIELKEESDGLMGVLKKLGSPAEIDRFMGWIAANRSAKLAEEGRENLFTESEIKAGVRLNEGNTKEGKNRLKLYENVFSEFQEYRNDVLKIAEESGIISSENRSMWADEFYVPFYRVMEEESAGNKFGGSKGLSRQQAYKKLKGGNQELNDLLENTLMNFQHLLSSSLKNNAAKQAMDNALKVGVAEQVIESRRDLKTSTFVLEKGVKKWYEISDPLVYESLTTLIDPSVSTFSRKMMRSFKRVFTGFITASPQFMVANSIRDTMHAMAIGNLSYNGFKNFAEGAKDYGSPLHKGKLKGDMLASGAAFSFGHLYGTGDPDALHAELERNINGAKVIRSPKDVTGMMRKAWDTYSAFGDTSENANRASMYKQNLGKGKLYAAFQARDLMDFSSHGAWPAVRFLVDTVPFLNARLIGLDRMYRGGVKPTFNVIKHMMGSEQASISDKEAAKRFSIVVGALTAASIALYLHNQDDEEFRELEDWQKDMYWYIRIGENKFFIPKPFEVGAIATIAERGIEQMTDDTKSGKLFIERMGHIVSDTFAFNPVPQMFKPVLDLYANKSSFTGRDIETMGMDRLSKINRVRTNTTDLAKGSSWVLDNTVGKLSQSLVVSPVQADYLVQQYLGWVGTMGAATVDIVSKSARGHESPYKSWDEYQPIRRFYKSSENPSYTRYGTEFYNVLRETSQVYADIKYLRLMGEDEVAAELSVKNKNKLQQRKLLNRTQRKLGKLSARSKLIHANRSLGAVEKRRLLDQIQTQRNLIQKRIIDKLEEAKQ